MKQLSVSIKSYGEKCLGQGSAICTTRAVIIPRGIIKIDDVDLIYDRDLHIDIIKAIYREGL